MILRTFHIGDLALEETATPDVCRVRILGQIALLSRAEIRELHQVTSSYSSYGDFFRFVEEDTPPEEEPVQENDEVIVRASPAQS